MKKFGLIICLLMAVVACQEKMPFLKDSEVLFVEGSNKTLGDAKCPTIDMAEALSIIKSETDQYPDRWIDISKDIIPAGTRIDYAPLGIKALQHDGTAVKSPNYDSWLAVVEYDMCINGGQGQVLHFFINSETGEYTSMWLDGKAIVEWDTSRNIYVESKTDNDKLKRRSLPRVRTRTSSSSTSPTQWAVILSGGGNVNNNCARYWNDCQYVYKALTQELDYPSDHIICLVSDGIDPAHDRRTGPNTYDSSPLDFDGDGIRDIEYSASKRDLATVFSYLGSVVSAGDEVLVFITDHGGEGGTICLWNNEILTPSELNTELNKITYRANIDIIMGQCYSGVTTQYIIGENRTIATAVDKKPYSIGSGIDGYDFFLKYWTDAIYSINSSVVGQYSNGDGFLSVFELFNYSKQNNPCVSRNEEDPKISSRNNILVWGHDLLGNRFIPYIEGPENVSSQHSQPFYVRGVPSSITPSWSCSNDLYIVSSNDYSVIVSGKLPSSKCASMGASISASFTDLGCVWSVKKDDVAVWYPGAYVGNGNIIGNNGYYFLSYYPSHGTYPGTSNYMWNIENSTWTITQQEGATIRVNYDFSSSYADLSVSFNDPFSDMIYVSDRISL